MQTSPYLLFTGECESAFKFYETHLGGKILVMMKHAGTPAEGQVPVEWNDKIMHGRIQLGDTVVMASDAPPGRQQKAQGFRLSLSFDKSAEAERAFNALADGGSVEMPFAKTFFAERFGMVTDRFGTPWMINCEHPA
ncbi:MAG TPA: VOC family protein [Stellaceae bacterium]|jgi:PhnB protein